ncbi:hypothetical protein, conserved [Babesia bigemina]|uniref:Uncharacterized protein n=1 Tax=Babesia bigemina TaxID=5866 RepID=A0A061D5C9_BABBI|nr:hypothetical protein, conserved [Babesia bigemina]CDR95242.1 hypothetical protein, conserved [Babesia bigemina]|eukprot:XP_012767428.1 hypothetical protein, conserved [Babesia bigemina]
MGVHQRTGVDSPVNGEAIVGSPEDVLLRDSHLSEAFKRLERSEHTTVQDAECESLSSPRCVPILRGCIHLLLALMSPLLIVWLMQEVVNENYIAEYFIAFVCCILNFSASAMLHHMPWNMQSYDMCLKLDYACIFLMIGGSAVPSTYAAVSDNLGVLTTLIQWAGVSLGAVGALAFSFVASPPSYRLLVYFAAGSPYLYHCYTLYNIKCFIGLLSACLTLVIYMSGGIIYVKEAPNPSPHYFGFHEIFHLCCAMALVTTFVGNHKITNFVNDI